MSRILVQSLKRLCDGHSPLAWDEVKRGAHVRVTDGGLLYDELSRYPCSPRVSSHKSDSQQYEVRLKVEGRAGYLLFGVFEGCSWFQLERHSGRIEAVNLLSGAVEGLRHLGSFVQYRLTGRNVGPFGTSPHTETRDPIVIAGRL